MNKPKGEGLSSLTLDELEVLKDLVPLVRRGVIARSEDILADEIVWLSGNTLGATAYKIDMYVKDRVCVLRMFVGGGFARFRIGYPRSVTPDDLLLFIDSWESKMDDYIADANQITKERK